MPRAPVKARARGNVISNISPYYIGWWPMTLQLIPDGSGGLTYNKITLLQSATVSTSNDWYEHADIAAASWLTAGLPIKFRADPTALPTGLSPNIIYYAGLPASNRLRAYFTAAGGIAGGGAAGVDYVDITATGAPNSSVIYPAIVYDKSGNDNDMLFATNCHDTVAFGDLPYMSSATNATNDQSIGKVPVATLNERWNWPNYSLLIMAKMMMTDAMSVGARGILGCGAGTASDGPRLQTASVDDGRIAMTMRHGGSGASSLNFTQSASIPFTEDGPEVSFAYLFDANEMWAHMWLNGFPDRLASFDRPTGLEDIVVTPSLDFRFGGAGSANCQAMGFRDVHLLSIPSNVVFHMPTLHDQIMGMASGNYNFFLDGDF